MRPTRTVGLGAALVLSASLALAPSASFAAGAVAAVDEPVKATTVRPEQIPFSAPDLVNMNRGQYRWGGMTVWGANVGKLFPNALPDLYSEKQFWSGATVNYYRVPWTAVETEDGQLDFSILDKVIAEAAARGEKTAFRVMPMDTCCGYPAPDETKRLFPKYLVGQINEYIDKDGNYIPDFNNPTYLKQFKRLLTALGERYDADDRISYVDMMGYGDFGEWHLYGHEMGPNGQTFITPENSRMLVDANMKAFRQTQVLTLTGQEDAIKYGISKYPQLGIRMDCMGDANGGGAWLNMLAVPGALQRWQTQPLHTEWCTSNYSSEGEIWKDDYPYWMGLKADVGVDQYEVGRRQVQRYHVSTLSSGNFQHAWNNQKMTDEQFSDWSMANKTAGYRYSVVQATIPQTAKAKQEITVKATWRNAGVAPTYDAWNARIVVLNAAGQEVKSTKSQVDLGSLYAKGNQVSETPRTADRVVKDQVVLPNKPGKYTIAVKVGKVVQKRNATAFMPSSFYNTPMQLAQEGRTDLGAYPIGTVTVTK